MPFNTQVTPGVLAKTHKALRDSDSLRLASGNRGSRAAATEAVFARLRSVASLRSPPKRVSNCGT